MIQYCDNSEKGEKKVIKNPPGYPPGFMKISDNVCKVKFVNE